MALSINSAIALKLLSTLFILLPISYGLKAYKAGRTFQLFTFFLMAGFMSDGLAAFHNLILPLPQPIIKNRLPVYCLIEALFFLWFIVTVGKINLIKLFIRPLLLLVLVSWTVLKVVFPESIYSNYALNIFEAAYQVIVSFLASAVLLNLIEKQEPQGLSSTFWLALGIFFYSFSTFFLALLKYTFYQETVWPIHNILNIITYLLYTKGFLVAKQI